MSKVILAFAREAGGAEAIAPVINLLRKKTMVIVTGKDYALSNFKNHNFEVTNFPICSYDDIDEAVLNIAKDIPVDGLLTSATSLPENDMTERYLWKWAERNDIPSVGVVDQWQNYAIRFSGPYGKDKLKYLPTKITAIDEMSKKEMSREGIPGERVVVTGQPAFDNLVNWRESFTVNDREGVRRQCGANPEEYFITFVSECLKGDFNLSYGYTEDSIVEVVLNALVKIVGRLGKKIRFIVKQHRQNAEDDFKDVNFNLDPMIDVSMIRDEIAPRPLVLASDLVIGMASILLVESILLGKLTMSVQIDTVRDDLCIATRVGAIPLIRSGEMLDSILKELFFDTQAREKYLDQQNVLSVDGHSSEKVSDLLWKLVSRS